MNGIINALKGGFNAGLVFFIWVGWIMNLIAVAQAVDANVLTGKTLLCAVGVFIPPLGAALGMFELMKYM